MLSKPQIPLKRSISERPKNAYLPRELHMRRPAVKRFGPTTGSQSQSGSESPVEIFFSQHEARHYHFHCHCSSLRSLVVVSQVSTVVVFLCFVQSLRSRPLLILFQFFFTAMFYPLRQELSRF